MDAKAKNKRLLKWMLVTVLGMFAFAYALVPLYRVLCKATGINGRVFTEEQQERARKEVQQDTPIDYSRMITVQFLATNNGQLPWDFRPMTKVVKMHPGELTKVKFYARNNTHKAMTVQAIPSVSPGLAVKHLHKTECFCFENQTLSGGEAAEMPIIFH